MVRTVLSCIINNKSNLVQTVLVSLLAVVTVTGLGAVVLTAWFGVPMGDDYLAIKTFSNKHTWLAEAWHAFTGTSRYAQSVTASFTYGLFRNNIAIILPLIVVAWTYILIVLYLRLANRRLGLFIPSAASYLIAAPLLFIFIGAGKPDSANHLWFAYQPFYFSSAIVTYTIGILLLLSCIYFALTSIWFRNKNIMLQSVLVFATAYVLGLYNETTPATVFGISIIAAAALLLVPSRQVPHRKRLITLLCVSALASLAALLTMYFSPANLARRQLLGSMGVDTSDIATGIISNVTTTLSTLMLKSSDILLLIVVGLVFYLAVVPHRSHSRLSMHATRLALAGLGLVGTGVVSVIITLILSAIGYGADSGVYPRTLLIPQLLIYGGIFVLSVGIFTWLYGRASMRPVRIPIVVLIVIGTLLVVPHHVSRSAAHLARIQDYHASWQDQDAMLREQAKHNPQVPAYVNENNAGIGDGFSLRCRMPQAKGTHWLNEGMEAYYGLDTICSDET